MNFTHDAGSNGWGRLTGTAWGGSSCTGGAWSQSFQYNVPGRVTRKTQVGGNYTLEANFTYNTLGQLVSTQYPNSGPTFTYTFDSMARPSKLTSSAVDWVKDVLYNTAGQMTQMRYTRDTGGSAYYTETRSYNVLGQMTQIQIPGVVDRTYTFSGANNDGRITQMADAVSGETVQYQYDSLKRLISAATTGSQWGQSFSYDGFGNLLNQVVTKGSAPSMSLTVNPATNRINGYSYDSNGNLTAMTNLTLSYDVENRLVQSVHSANGTESYVYDPSNQRVWKQEPSRTLVYFYSLDGTLLATYGDGANSDYNVYFAGKQIWAEKTPVSPYQAAGPVALDRLGSVVHRYGSANRYFPYGDEPSTTTQDRVKFATYYRDSTSTLDYAQNRYYSRSIARFTTPDPSGPRNETANPQGWNQYEYVENDPVNHNDPSGLSIALWFDSTIWDPWYGWIQDGGSGGGGWDFCDDGWGPSLLPNWQCSVPWIVGAFNPPAPPELRLPRLVVVGDCYRAQGTGFISGWTRVITYQVVDQFGKPFYGDEVPTVAETVTTTKGPKIDGSGVWSRNDNSMDPQGRFVDFLSANGSKDPSIATQIFSAGGFSLRVNIGEGNPTVLNNTYSKANVKVNGTTSPRPCTDGDPVAR